MVGGAGAGISLTSKRLQAEIDRRISEAGFGPFQLLSLLCTGGIMMSEGSEVIIMSSITEMLSSEWGLDAFTRAFMVAIVYVGFATGNVLSGALGDRYGRRPTILVAYVTIGVFGFVTSWATNAVMMTCIRFLVGVGCGIGFAAVYTLITELCPTDIRGALCAAMIGFMPLGETYASIGVVFIDDELEGLTTLKWPLPLPGSSWRRLCQWSALPSFFLMAACTAFLKESPYFLARNGRYDELNDVLKNMESYNGKPVQGDVLVPEETLGASKGSAAEASSGASFSYGAAVAKLVSGRYFSTTLVMFFAHFTKDFSYFGCNYVFPQYFAAMASSIPVGFEMLTISFVAVPGVAAAVYLTQWKAVGHIQSLTYIASACALLATGLESYSPVWMEDICACAVKNLIMMYFIVVVVYTAEVFPTSMRNTAVGICTACGRVGSISAPMVFELSPGFDFFWSLIITFMSTIAFLATLFLTVETKGKALADDDHHDTKVDLGYSSTDSSAKPLASA